MRLVSASASDLTVNTHLDYLINHLFLPPKLPQEDDSDPTSTHALLRHVSDSAAAFLRYQKAENAGTGVLSVWRTLYKMLQSMEKLHKSIYIPLKCFRSAINNMEIHDVLALHICKQNAGLILRKPSFSHLTLEFFQASPTAAAVASTAGKLIVKFPSRPRLLFPTDSSAIDSLCALLVDLDCTRMPDAVPVTRKAGSVQIEVREVADIRYISELLGGIARACTEDVTSVAERTTFITKRIDDHVLWKSALLPWRRAPSWMIIRVVLQTTLEEWEMDPRYGYKVFITFVLAKLLERAVGVNVAHDVLSTMNAKIAIRISKFPPIAGSSPVVQYIAQQIKACGAIIRQRWEEIQAAEALPLNWKAPTMEEIEKAKEFCLTNSRIYLSQVYNRSNTLSTASDCFSPSAFEASLLSSSTISSTGKSPPAQIPQAASGVDLWVAVLDLERWVACDMPLWLSNTSFSDRVETLRQMIERHHILTASFQKSNPELFSRAFLTQMELWVALDETVVNIIPLLAKYSPELDVKLCEPLLLPTLDQMIRAQAVEEYLYDRHHRAVYSNHSIFKFDNHCNAFSARYFDKDPALQSLHLQIIEEATRQRSFTRKECQTLNDEYKRLTSEASSLDHTYWEARNRWGDPIQEHSYWCHKCSLNEQANSLTIRIHEWPLPEAEVLSKLVVFELRVPNAFGVWRDITFSLAYQYSSAILETDPSPVPVLCEYPALSAYFNATTAQQLTIASTAKSFLVSHYEWKDLPCDEDDVVKNHALRYDLFDGSSRCWINPSVFLSMSIRTQCTPSLPPGPYDQLDWSIVGTKHTPNMVIARQSQCPSVISYHEWDSFGHLRAGNRLQWRNMMLELIRGTLTLGNPATYLLFRQAAWQAEKASSYRKDEDPRREAHLDLAEPKFGQEALTVLQARFANISANWQEGWTAATLSMIACRLFSLSMDERVKEDVRAFLACLRQTLSGWMEHVLRLKKSKASKYTIEAMNELRDRIIQLAVICRSTYMLDGEIGKILRNSNALTLFIDSAIVLQNILPANLSSLSSPLRYMVEKDVVFSAEVFDVLKTAIYSNNLGLDNAIRRNTWQAFQRNPRVPWHPIGDRWVTCQTSSEGNAQVCFVYLNLHDGTFLVNGKTIAGLPKEILRHSLFQALFQNQSTADIVPSTMKGMDYQLSTNIRRQEVHFALRGHDLLVRTRDLQEAVSEFVPNEKLQGDIPNVLLHQTCLVFHNTDTSRTLEIYPTQSGWDPSASPTWRMDFDADPILPGVRQLVSIKSPADIALSPDSDVVKSIHAVLLPMETSPANLLAVSTSTVYHGHPTSNQNVQVKLPRYKLNFFVNIKGDLECKDLPGFSVSDVQSIGTLCGLKNKLVLKTADGQGMRRIIIPNGNVKVFLGNEPTRPHHRVTITPPSDPGHHIRVFMYDVDDLIGRLVGDGTLTSWYTLAYLHILTSYLLSDPLIHRTGVQQALQMLCSANSFSFMELTDEHRNILSNIVNLTPTRQYYPIHLTSMETVTWHPILLPHSQIAPYTSLVEAILRHGNNQRLFRTGGLVKPLEVVRKGSGVLRKRAEFRNARFVSSELQELGGKPADVRYVPSRCLEVSDSADKEQDVVEMANLTHQWPTGNLEVADDIWHHFKKWKSFSNPVDFEVDLNSPRTWLLEGPSYVWFALLSLFRRTSRERDVYGITFTFGILAYRRDFDRELCHSLLAVATHDSHAALNAAALLPNGDFDLGPGHTLELQEVQRLTEKHRIKFNESHQLHLTLRFGETREHLAYRRQVAHESEYDAQCGSLAKTLFSSWPCPSPHMPTTWSSYSLIDTSEDFKKECKELFSSRFNNYRLFQCTTELQVQLNSIFGMTSHTHIPPAPPTSSHQELPHSLYAPFTLRILIEDTDRIPDVSSNIRGYGGVARRGCRSVTADASAIRNLLTRIQSSSSEDFTTRYTEDLLRCVSAFERPPSTVHNTGKSLQLPFTDSSLQSILDTVIVALKPKNLAETMLSEAGLWPSTGQENLLGQLSLHSRKGLPNAWRSALTSLAESVAAKQQALRLNKFMHLGLDAEYRQEYENSGGQGWDMMAYPDWLLIQLDANLLIRPVQASVAQEMMAPKSQTNTVMQLNMGDGKSSVIVPIISAALADGEQLVRVLVLKPLCTQMFGLLKQRICRLSNRRLFYLPFCRDMKLDVDKIRTIIDLFKECARVGGVLVCQPEHILSFQLMGLHTLCHGEDTDKSRLLLDGQDWLNQESRDILDESDEILSVRYQLIYTVGTPKALQGQPGRWETVQEVFSLLKACLKNLTTRYPRGLEVETTGTACDRFPRTRILSQECGLDLMETMARQIVYEERMKSISFRSYPNNLRTIAFQFLTDTTVTAEASHTLNMYSGDYFDQLLLLRGLIAHGILLHSLKEKRWRVDYGLDPSRSMLAVPYRAKDSPASRAEFGHPEMILVLTCLSYYYGGLTNDQMDTTFQRLYATDNPDLRYEDWIKGSPNEIPETLRNLRGLNLNDTEQKLGRIFPLLRYNKSVIDFYLSECVFPKEVKEFEHKLTTNAWDLARKKTRLTTGFSGTNDHSYLLPLSIHQLDAEAQRHTNAQVLEYLLLPENRYVINTGSSTAKELIQRVVAEEQHVMVLLDVGAQVLELQNEDVAREWLELDTRSHVEAAIHCNPNDEFYVVTRDGRNEPLATSVYNSQLDKALVYLDEAHTRGTDFKFPKGTRAVVTLGPKTTKDKLVQGCMRMRKLGSVHSILFFASGEVWGKIEMCINTHKDTLDSSDVLLWTMRETCTQIIDNGALWASQGENFDRRHAAWEKYAKGSLTQLDLANVLREPESRTLEELYGVRVEQDLKGGGPLSECQEGIRKKCREYGIRPGRSSALLEEQERELAHEKEEERQVERVVDAKPLEHSLDPTLKTLVRTGRHSSSLKSVSLLQCLQETTLYSSLIAVSHYFFRFEHLVATVDFSRTVALSSGDHMDDFLRAVQWVLTTTTSPNVLLLLSPFEANELLPEIRLSRYANLHIYSARTSRTVRSLDGLDFFTVSQQPGFTFSHHRVIHELNLFSGQLFFNDRASFEEVCDMLGLYLDEIPGELQGKCDALGFVHDKGARRSLGIHNCLFEKNPVAVLRELIGWRRKGQGYTLTHVGAMLHGNNLGSDEFVA